MASPNEVEHVVDCEAPRETAWRVWTDVSNWPKVDAAVESVELDGPFAAGARGRTATRGAGAVEWSIAEVDEGARALIEISGPGAELWCEWRFDERGGGGSRIAQGVWVTGERADEVREHVLADLAQNMPEGMRRLADFIDRSSDGSVSGA